MVKIEGYEAVEPIHEGGRSLVYKAVRRADGRPATLKTPVALYPGAGQISSLNREFELLDWIRLPGVPRAIELVEKGPSLVLAMEYFDCQPLGRLTAAGPLDLDDFFTMAVETAAVLAGLHQQGLCHCDLGGGNILFNPRTGRAALVDLSAALETPRQARPVINPRRPASSRAYMSPEQTGRMNRGLDHRTDFYSLGVVFYQALTGRPPFTAADPDELIRAHLTAQPRPPGLLNPGIPPLLSDLVLKLLAKDPADRYRSAEGLVHDLEYCLDLYRGVAPDRGFQLGRTDLPDRFVIPEKLYDRSAEADRLTAALESAARGQGRMVFIAGRSGVGKTSLVRELHRPLARRGGYIVSGKFDQYRQRAPYSALAAALAGLTRRILDESADRIAAWKERIIEAVGVNGRLLVEVIPELGLLLGPQPPPAELPAAEAGTRFGHVFRSFIAACAAPDRPLVVFLDDLQWIDSSSLVLLELLAASIDETAVLIIGAYRDDETPPDHPLSLSLDRLRRSLPDPIELKLTELSPEALVELLSETLSLPWGDLVGLNELLFQKTGGNPLFYKILLSALHSDGRLIFDYDQGRWTWDLSAIEAARYADNAADVLRRRIGESAGAGTDLLGLGAALGNSFDLDLPAAVSGRGRAEAARLVRESVANGLIQPLEENYELLTMDRAAWLPGVRFRFSHDLVRQAAYSLLDPTDRPDLHARIGRLLYNRLRDEENEALLFEAADQLNQGPLPVDKTGRTELARLNLSAGRKAKAAAAFSDAVRRFEAASRALGDDPWSEHPALALEIHLELAEAGYLVSDFDRAEKLYPVIRRRAATDRDLLGLINIQAGQYRRQGRFQEAINLEYEALTLLGQELPRKEEELFALFTAQGDGISALLNGAAPETIAELDEIDDPETTRLHEILFNLFIDGCRSGRPALQACAAATGARLTLERGSCPMSSIGLINYAVCLCAGGRRRTGYSFARAAVRLADKYRVASLKNYTYHLYSLSINHWFKPLSTSCDYWRQAAKSALESGSPYTGWIFLQLAHAVFASGAPLSRVEEQLAESARHLKAARQGDPAFLLKLIVGQPLAHLRGRTKAFNTLDDDDFDSAACLDRFKDVAFVAANLHYARLRVLLLAGEYQPLSIIGDWMTLCEEVLRTEFIHVDCALYFTLHLTRGFDRAAEADKPAYLEAVREKLDGFAAWAELRPENFRHKLLLLRAEKARIDGDPSTAGALFDQAVEAAVQRQFLNDAALASETAGLMRLDEGRPGLAQPYLEQALAAYHRWGAWGMVERLRAQHPCLRRRGLPTGPDQPTEG